MRGKLAENGRFFAKYMEVSVEDCFSATFIKSNVFPVQMTEWKISGERAGVV